MTAVAQLRTPATGKRRPTRSADFQCVVVAGLLILVSGTFIAAHLAGVLRFVYPLLAFLTAIFFYWRSKPFYVGFVCWLWFLSPWLRRIVDLNVGWEPSNSILLAPYLATAVATVTVIAQVGRLGERRALPFGCAFAAVLYGTMVGLTHYSLTVVGQAALNWLVPIVFGFFLYHHRELYPQFRSALEKSFLFGVLLMGLYGTYQFFFLPEWDRFWMVNLNAGSFGAPEPFLLRVFSTMNAPAPFAAVMMAGLLVLFSLRGYFRMIAAAFGFLSLVLTSSRSSWLGLIAGLFYVSLHLNLRLRFRLVGAILATAAVMLLAIQIPVVDRVVSKRLNSFADPSHDASYMARIEGHVQAFQQIFAQPFGEGIGSAEADHSTTGDDDSIGPHDSTVLEFLYSLGWAGTLLYVAGLIVLAVQIFTRNTDSDSFTIAMKAVLVAFAAECVLNSVMIGVIGFIVWTASAMCLAGAQNRQEASASLYLSNQ